MVRSVCRSGRGGDGFSHVVDRGMFTAARWATLLYSAGLQEEDAGRGRNMVTKHGVACWQVQHFVRLVS